MAAHSGGTENPIEVEETGLVGQGGIAPPAILSYINSNTW